jgi:alkylation response protein AidB-like acyl-CoA dehydrogenase
MPHPPTSVDQVLANARALLPEIRHLAPQVEATRTLPASLVEALRHAGCLRMATPVEYGGLGCTQREVFQLIELLATADASVAWTTMVFGSGPAFLSRFPATTVREVYAAGPDIAMAALLSPSGVATPVPGGYRVSGRWRWASGSAHAVWFVCTCRVPPQAHRLVLLSPAQVERVDTWQVSGLRGTGSGDVIAPYFTALALGVAQGALHDTLALARADKRRLASPRRMADDPLVQHRLGEADALLRAARHAFYGEVDAWEKLVRTLPPEVPVGSRPELAALNATAVWALQSAAAVVDTAYHAGGGSSVWSDAPLQQRFRDMHVATQHIAVSDAAFARHGAALMGGSA